MNDVAAAIQACNDRDYAQLPVLLDRIQAVLSEQQGGHYNDRATEVWREGYYKLAEERNSLRAQLAEQQAEIERLKRGIDLELVRTGEGNREWARRVEQLQAENSKLREELERLRAENQSYDEDNAAIVVNNEQLAKERDELQIEVDKFCAFQRGAAEERIVLRENLTREEATWVKRPANEPWSWADPINAIVTDSHKWELPWQDTLMIAQWSVERLYDLGFVIALTESQEPG